MEEIRSIDGYVSTGVNFDNKSGHKVQVLWLDHKGKPVWYNDLKPGEGYHQQTYVTHPWVCVEIDTGRFELMEINSKEVLHPEKKHIRGVITEPKRSLYELCVINMRHYLLQEQGSNIYKKLKESQVKKLPLPQRVINDILSFDSTPPSPLVVEYVNAFKTKKAK